MELVKESLEIDELIHKLYGLGGNIDMPQNESLFDDDITVYSSSEELKSLLRSVSGEEFDENISDILIESLDFNDLMLIKEAITEYLD